MKLLDVLPILLVSIVVVKALPRRGPTTESYFEVNKGLIYYGLLVNCTNEHNVTLENYLWISEKNDTEGSFERSKCVDACILRALEVLKPDGTIDMKNAKVHFLIARSDVEFETLRQSIENCNPKDEDECVTAHNMMVCAYMKDGLP